MNIGNVFVYCLYACLQMYILMSTGYLAFKKKLFTSQSISIVSEFLFVYLIPVYGIIEISRIGTIEILNIFWILVANFVCALALSYLLAIAFHYSFNLDKRVKESFNLVLAVPAMGALPLVIGKAFCFPGGPMEGDIYCQNIIGLMMLCYLILCIMVFLIGYLLLISDKKKNAVIIEKMMYLWPILVDKLFGKDEAVRYLFEKFIGDKQKCRHLFEKFDKEHHDDILSLYRNENQEKILMSDQGNSKGNAVTDIQLDVQLKNNGEVQPDAHLKQIKANNTDKDKFNDSYFEYCSHETKTIRANSPYKGSHCPKTNLREHKNLTSQLCILFKRKDSFYPGDNIKPKFDIEARTEYGRNNYSNKVTSERKIKTNFFQSNLVFKRAKSDLNLPFQICSKNGPFSELNGDCHSQKDYRTPTKHFEQNQHSPDIVIVDECPVTEENNNKQLLVKKKKEIIVDYYQSAFEIIDQCEGGKKDASKEYEENKREILMKVSNEPPKYPIVLSVLIDQNALDIIEEEWIKFEPQLKALSPDFSGFNAVSIDLNVFMKKVVSPPTLSIMLGLILSISGIRGLIFNKENFFFTNIVDGLDTLDKVMVPFLFCLIGLSAANTDGLGPNTPLTKKHIILVFIARFIIIPFVGLGFIYLWKEYYGGIVKESLAFRIIMYFPWCLPSAPNLAVVINLTQYFFEEYGYLILLQNASCVITLTILYMIYFITVGL